MGDCRQPFGDIQPRQGGIVMQFPSPSRGYVQIIDKRGTREYPALDLEQLDLRIVDLGGTLTPVIPYIYIRVLYGRRVLHHSEYKNEGLGNIQEPPSSRTKLQANNIMIC